SGSTGGELVAGGGGSDQSPDESAAAELDWGEHVAAAVAAPLAGRGGSVASCLLRESPDLHIYVVRTGGLGGWCACSRRISPPPYSPRRERTFRTTKDVRPSVV